MHKRILVVGGSQKRVPGSLKVRGSSGSPSVGPGKKCPGPLQKQYVLVNVEPCLQP